MDEPRSQFWRKYEEMRQRAQKQHLMWTKRNDTRGVRALKPQRHWLKSQTISYFLWELLLTNPKIHSQPLPLCYLHQKASRCPQSWSCDLVCTHEVMDTEKIPPDLISIPHLFLLWVWARCLELGQHPHNHDKNTKGIPEVSPDFTVSLNHPQQSPSPGALFWDPSKHLLVQANMSKSPPKRLGQNS